MNNKGFAVSTFMYMVLILGIILILATLAILSSRKMIIDKQKNTAMDNSLQSRKKICKAVSGEKSLTLGTKYECEVNEEDTFYFYVLSVEGSKVNLIMDRNICEDGTTAYASTNDYCRYMWESNDINGNGPIDVMTALGNATRNWNNVPNINLVYNDITDNTNSGYTNTTYGYTGITIISGVGYITKKDGTTQTTITLTDNKKIKSRLPKLKEITEAGCHVYSSTADYGACPVWLMGNISYYNVSSYAGSGNTDKYSMNNVNNEAYQNQIYGYWLLSSYPGETLSARLVDYGGIVSRHSIASTLYYGMRPVITVSKSNLYK